MTKMDLVPYNSIFAYLTIIETNKMSRTSEIMHNVPKGSLQNTDSAQLDGNNRKKTNEPRSAAGITYIIP
jgi:hypothetical protein